MMTKNVERMFVKNQKLNGTGGVKAVLGFTKIDEQEPYFHAMCGAWDSYDRAYTVCADHKLLAEKFPEYAGLARWHLCGLTSGPMHYEANAIYWSEKARGVSRWPASPGEPNPVEAFKSTVVWGGAADDGTDADAIITALQEPDELTRWLAARKSALMAAFRADVEAAFPGMWAEAERLGQPGEPAVSAASTSKVRVICRKKGSASRVFTDGKTYEEVGREGSLIIILDDIGYRRAIMLDEKPSPHLCASVTGGRRDTWQPVGHFEVVKE